MEDHKEEVPAPYENETWHKKITRSDTHNNTHSDWFLQTDQELCFQKNITRELLPNHIV